MSYQFKIYSQAADMVSAVTDVISQNLKQAIRSKGKAQMLLSGGSSPRPVYEALSNSNLAWDKVSIGLVDDRWVKPGQHGSNETFILQTLMQNKAETSTFLGLKSEQLTASQGVTHVNKIYQSNFDDIDICIMGMGTDGHTASWFPYSQGLKEALDIDNKSMVCSIDAKGCPVAGDMTERITVSLPVIMSARHVFLLISGQEKRDVFENAANKNVFAAPVNALFAAGARLTVFWGA